MSGIDTKITKLSANYKLIKKILKHMTPLLTKTIKVSTTQVVFPDVFLKLYQQYHFIRQTQQERNLKFQSSERTEHIS